MKELPKIDPDQPIAIDLETCDPELKTLAPGYITKVGFVAGYAIAAEEGSFYIPVGHTEGQNYNHDEVKDWLNQTLAGNTDKVFHNAQYDIGWLKYAGVSMKGQVFDTMLAAASLDENRKSYTLDYIGKEYMNEGKNEVALEAAVKAKYANVKTHKTIIRLKEDICKTINYQPFYDAKKRVCPFFDLYPQSVKDKYDVCGIISNSRGQELYKVPTTTMTNIKGLLWSVDPAEMGSYPIQDVDLTYKLYKKFKSILSSEKLDNISNLENELLLCLLEMREQGVKIDLNKAVELDKDYSKRLLAEQTELDNLAGFPVNVDATVDLVKICDKFDLKYSLTDKGNPCFDSVHAPDHKTFELISKIKNLNKARNTYIRGYFFNSSIEGRLHGQYHQLKSDDGGTVTGRLSSSGPNLQNIPAREEIGEQMRSLFIPDKTDEKWLCMDFSGQEPKMLVNLVLMLDKQFGTRKKIDHVTGEVTVYHEEGFPGATLARQPIFSGRQADFHTAVARECIKAEYKKEGIDYTEEMLAADAKKFRKKAKSIGLGIMYGSGSKKIAEGMTEKGIPMTTAEAQELKDSICKNIPFFGAINKYVMDLAKRRGYVLTLLKRRGRFDTWETPIWNCPNERTKTEALKERPYFRSCQEGAKWVREEGEKFEKKHQCSLGTVQRAFTYKALNKIIQGSSSDQTKTAMLHLYKRNNMNVKALDIYYRRADFEPPKSRIQVHDEMNFSIKPDEDISWYQDTMENSLPLLVESVAEPGVGNNWNEAK